MGEARNIYFTCLNKVLHIEPAKLTVIP